MNLFKNKEEAYRSTLPKNKIIGLRLDGRAFHSFTKQFSKPYDMEFMGAMDATALYVIQNVLSCARVAYVQSDEISILFSADAPAQLPFDGKVEKILSVAASAATGGFMQSKLKEGAPMFDARLFELDSKSEAEDYLEWRRKDARKNAISMAAETVFPVKELLGKSTFERMGMLQGTEYERLPDGFFHGRFVRPVMVEGLVEYVDKRTEKTHSTRVQRKEWVVQPALPDLVTQVV